MDEAALAADRAIALGDINVSRCIDFKLNLSAVAPAGVFDKRAI
jgi:hypothetical protein